MEPGTSDERIRGIPAAVSEAAHLLCTDASEAERLTHEILAGDAAQREALGLLVSARRAAGDRAGARAMLEALAEKRPDLAAVQYELALLLAADGDHLKAIDGFSNVVALEPAHTGAWRRLGDELTATGQAAAAADAYLKHLAISTRVLRTVEHALGAGALPEGAEAALRKRVHAHPTDIHARRLLGEIHLVRNRFQAAAAELAEVVRLAPAFAMARYRFAFALYKQTKVEEALRQLDLLLKENPGNVACLNLKALSLLHLGDYVGAIACYEKLLTEDNETAAFLVGYGHALKTVGRTEKAIAAYKRAIALQPDLGEAYWQLADLKTFRFNPSEIRAMRKTLAVPSLTEGDRTQLHFALGKALEDSGDYANSFEEYAKGNAVRRGTVRYSAAETSDFVQRAKALFTADFFRARQNAGCSSPDPIFIVGLTRSGSTLIEQILASHSMIEGTQELPTVNLLVSTLEASMEVPAGYPELLSQLDTETFVQLGEEYVGHTRVHRKLGRPFFIDKMPANFFHAGLLHVILPRAKIIDARRHPLACGFANFKQHFTHGQPWSYDLVDIGRYYRDYVDLLAHFDEVLPGRIHRVVYEALIADPEREVRRLLAYCGVPFEEACLRFYENQRPVLTASAEQVRRPISRDSLNQWRHFEPWLGPLKSALGSVLDNYPTAPVAGV